MGSLGEKVARWESVLKTGAAQSEALSKMGHPYHPPGLKLAGYQPAALPLERLLAVFFGASFLLLFVVWLASGGQPCSVLCGRREQLRLHTCARQTLPETMLELPLGLLRQGSGSA